MNLQEEVENRTVNLAITTTKLTTRHIIKLLWKLYRMIKNKMEQLEKAPHGKQSVKKLLGQNQGAATSEVDRQGIREFEQLARKYGVNFAVRKDKSVDPPRYTVFVRAKDADALDAICKEYQSRAMSKGKKPSVLTQLNQFKELVAALPKKLRVKQQERDL